MACLSSFRGTGSTELTDSEGFDRIPQKNIKADDKVMCLLYVCFYCFFILYLLVMLYLNIRTCVETDK